MPTSLEKKLGRKALTYADNDQWESCLSILRHDTRYVQQIEKKKVMKESNDVNGFNSTIQEIPKIWLHGRTLYGDYLVHHCAFAACENSLDMDKRRIACYCLKLVLEWEGMKASQRVAGDGGTALHGALASVSSSVHDIYSDNENDDNDDEENEEESDDEHKDLLQGRILNNSPTYSESNLDEEIIFFDSLLNHEEITIRTISLLLEAGADPNTKLVNILDLASNDNLNNEDEEIELNYAREAIIQQWNPLVMIIIWIALTLRKYFDSIPSMEQELKLPITILQIMITAGGDPSYEIGQSSPHSTDDVNQWRPLEFAAICFVGYDQYFQKNRKNEKDILSPWKLVNDLLIRAGSPTLTIVQSFIIHILSNDCEQAKKLATNHSEYFEKQSDFYLLQVCDFFPLPEICFPKNEANTHRHLLEFACHMQAMDSIRFLLNHAKVKANIKMSESICRNSIISLFTPLNPHIEDFNVNNERKDFRQSICSEVIETYCSSHIQDLVIEQSSLKYSYFRQQVLDKLLLCACDKQFLTCTNASLNYARDLLTSIIVLGADPNIKSIIDTQVHGKQTPLHILAGNHYRDDGVELMQVLLSSNSNWNAENSDKLRPIQVALKFKNYAVAQLLWKYSQQYYQQALMSLESWMSLEFFFDVGIAAIECRDVAMFEYAVVCLRELEKQGVNNTKNDDGAKNDFNLVSIYLGKLLLRVMDPRSGFSSNHTHEHYLSVMKKVVLGILLANQFEDENDAHQSFPSFEQDTVSKKSVLHHVLSKNRFLAIETREILLRPLCQWAQVLANIDYRMNKASLISLPCHSNFGRYTPLHLACDIGCEKSVKLLIEYGADKDILDGEGNSPFDLLNKNSDIFLH